MPAGRAEDREGTKHAAGAAAGRLARLRESAADAYAAITAVEAELRAVAERRVTAEGILRSAAARQQAATRALTAHQRDRPGPVTQLITWFRARREWSGNQARLADAAARAETPLADARLMLAQAKAEFAALVEARARAVTELSRLTAECEAAQAEVAPVEAAVAQVARAEAAGAPVAGEGGGAARAEPADGDTARAR